MALLRTDLVFTVDRRELNPAFREYLENKEPRLNINMNMIDGANSTMYKNTKTPVTAKKMYGDGLKN